MRFPSLVALVLPFVVAACADTVAEPSDFPKEPLGTITSDNGALTIEVRTAPEQPPIHGVMSVELRCFDTATHAPVDGLDMTLMATMPAMGHGGGTPPTVMPMGDGRYQADGVGCSMAGRWLLELTMTGGGEPDTCDIPLEVR